MASHAPGSRYRRTAALQRGCHAGPAFSVAMGLGRVSKRGVFEALSGELAERLVLAGQVRGGPGLGVVAVFGRRTEREVRVYEMRSRERTEVGAAAGNDRVDLVSGGDRADRD